MNQEENSDQTIKEFLQTQVDGLTTSMGEHTRVESPLADSAGNEITHEDLQQMLGTESEPTIGRLQNMTTIGLGGIGAVFSAHDPALHREIAIKILRPNYRNQLDYVTSFIREARITAQIDHPNVIPVHRLGMFDDAGAYFTMKRVKGVTLAQILRKLREGDEETRKTYTRQRLLEIFVSICNGVAFAHSKGIIHRDLKPANIMVGDYGEVFIADWGLALYRAEDDTSHSTRRIKLGELPEENKSEDQISSKISGTPAFMAPEQVTGKNDELDAQTDVYALGTILYSILTWEASPIEDVSTVTELMRKVAQHKILRPRRRAPKRRIPYELEAITLKAMHFDKSKRYETVIALLSDVRNYLAKYPVSAYSPLPLYRFYKFIRRRPLVPVTLMAALLTLGVWNLSEIVHNKIESRSLLSMAQNMLDDCDTARNRALSNRRKLNDIFTSTGKTEIHGNAVTLKSWFLRFSNEFNVACNKSWETINKLQALNVDNNIIAELFARLFTAQIQFATTIDSEAMLNQTSERLWRLPPAITNAIFAASPSLARQFILLKQDMGELKIKSGNPAIKFSAIKLSGEKNMQPLNAENADVLIKLDSAPAVNELKSGKYLIIAQMPDRRELRFPICIERDKLEEMTFDPPAEFPAGMVYIPEGNFIFGDRTFDDQFIRTRLPAYFISRYEVTFKEYLQFWKSLQPAERERFRAYVDAPASAGRKLVPLWNEKGELVKPYKLSMPVIGISYEAAEAYCRYMSRKTHLNYRLPTALEWEKAARGVDGREYVWGDDFKKDYACVDNRTYPEAVGSYPKDRSIYGVYDLTGNARELVINPGGAQYYTAKGSSFRFAQRFARLAAHVYASNLSDVGFRCVVAIPEK